MVYVVVSIFYIEELTYMLLTFQTDHGVPQCRYRNKNVYRRCDSHIEKTYLYDIFILQD